MRALFSVVAVLSILLIAPAQGANPRARDIGVPFDGQPGSLNAITDVAGVTVGQTTLIDSSDPKHLVRTGVTVILPRGRDTVENSVFGAWFPLNGDGEMTGTAYIDEKGSIDGPIVLTNTHSVGVVRDAVIAWRIQHGEPDSGGYYWSLPVVAETDDGYLNDINGFHVHPDHVNAALDSAHAGPVAEGNVGGGTGMICHEFKCGIGTSSRQTSIDGQRYTVGVLVQANYGIRQTLRIAGAPVGAQLTQHRVLSEAVPPKSDTGSIIIVVATDAPLLPTQLKRVARRAPMGLARNGSFAGDESGDLIVAFSTANPRANVSKARNTATFLSNDLLDPLFLATVEATEEAIINAMVAARDMHGQDGHFVIAIPHDQLRSILKKYNRLGPP
ncbi:MAG: P1 family peptidase [Pseudomonadota bacterium]|nr:P1 family peptidase [Pseudomonadota bacterium]